MPDNRINHAGVAERIYIRQSQRGFYKGDKTIGEMHIPCWEQLILARFASPTEEDLRQQMIAAFREVRAIEQ